MLWYSSTNRTPLGLCTAVIVRSTLILKLGCRMEDCRWIVNSGGVAHGLGQEAVPLIFSEAGIDTPVAARSHRFLDNSPSLTSVAVSAKPGRYLRDSDSF